MKQYGFRHRILLLAVALVVATQLVMLFPVLDLIKRDSAEQAERTVGLAGALFDEYMRNRDRAAPDDRQRARRRITRSSKPSRAATTKRRFALCCATTRAASARASPRCSTSTATVDVSSTADERPVPAFPSVPFADARGRHRAIASSTSAACRIRPSRCRCARPISARVGHARVSDRLRVGDAAARTSRASTSRSFHERRRAARAELDAARRPARERARGPRSEALRSAAHGRRRRRARVADAAVRRRQRRRLRRNAALGSRWPRRRTGACATSSTRSRASRCCSRSAARSGSRRPSRAPCRTSRKPRGACAKASTTSRSTSARPTSSASWPAASTRCSRRSRIASGASSIRRITTACPGLPNRELVVGLLRDAIEQHEKFAVVSLGLDRINGIVSSLGHRAGDEVVKLAAVDAAQPSRRNRHAWAT